VGMLPPGDDVIGLRQVDGMAQRPLSCWGKINATLLPHNMTAEDPGRRSVMDGRVSGLRCWR